MDALRQSFMLPSPTLTEQNLPNQANRVFIVTGGYTGVGLELCKNLYAHDATVYVAGRSAEKGAKGIEAIKKASPDSKGKAEFLHVDLADLSTIKTSADEFMSKESRLDVLTHNAGVMMTPAISESAQGYELQMGTNCLGPFLFTQCLVPVLRKTAATAPSGSVRVTWAGSLAVDLGSPKGAVAFDKTTGAAVKHSSPQTNYGQTKAGNVLLASEFTKRYPYEETKIISNSWNPGNLNTELQRHLPTLAAKAIQLGCYHPRFGAYTELWAGWSEEAGKPEENGKFIWPWGRFGGMRKDVAAAMKSEAEDGTGQAAKFWDWCEKETRSFT